MSMQDPIADALTRVRNALLRGHARVEMPYSSFKFELLQLLNREGYLGIVEKVADGQKQNIRARLRYYGGNPAIRVIKRLSRPGLRRYVGRQDIPVVNNFLGIVVLSTSKGLLTDQEARRLKVGGEVICEVF